MNFKKVIVSAFFFWNIAAMSASTNFYELKATSIEGKPVDFSSFKGKAVLVVNTASQCGYTPQYKGLQALSEKYGSKGLVVLGMPCNQFGAQEPEGEKKIKEFCELRYGVKFPLLQKADVNGDKQHPLYQYLISHSGSPDPIAWNFEKFLVDKNGKVVGRYKSKIEPTSPELTKAIESALN